MTKYTPGPWAVQQPSGRVPAYQITTAHGFPTYVGTASHNSNAEADARLMAAAPELLAALIRAKAEIGYFRRHAPNVLPVGHQLVAIDTLQQIDAAISKATETS